MNNYKLIIPSILTVIGGNLPPFKRIHIFKNLVWTRVLVCDRIYGWFCIGNYSNMWIATDQYA